MAKFSRMSHEQGKVDYVNLDAVARVYVEALSEEEWLVKVLLTSGAEIVEGRYPNLAAARHAVMDVLAP